MEKEDPTEIIERMYGPFTRSFVNRDGSDDSGGEENGDWSGDIDYDDNAEPLRNLYRDLDVLNNKDRFLQPWRTSMRELFQVYDAKAVLISAPEFGGPPNNDGKYDKPTMDICESLNWMGADRFTLGVDFVNSTSGQWVGSRVRGKQDGKVLHSDSDFDADYTDLLNGKKEDKFRLAVENSFWMCYWLGKTKGALTQALMSYSSASGLAVRKGKIDMCDACGPVFRKLPGRLVIAVSIDGGPVTQVEKMHIPNICEEVLSDIRRRQYGWAADAHIMWVHFPTAEDLLKSFSGRTNLCVDYSTKPFAFDMLGRPLTYTCGTEIKKESKSLMGAVELQLNDMMDIQQIIHEAGSGGAKSKDEKVKSGGAFIEACKNGWALTVASMLDQVDRDKNPCVDPNTTGNSLSGLWWATSGGHKHVVEELLKPRGNPQRKGADPNASPALCAAILKDRIDLAELLLNAKADPNLGDMTCVMPAEERAEMAESDDDELKNLNLLLNTTPLLAAVKKGRPDMVKLLLDHKADPAKSVGGENALDAAKSLTARSYTKLMPWRSMTQAIFEHFSKGGDSNVMTAEDFKSCMNSLKESFASAKRVDSDDSDEPGNASDDDAAESKGAEAAEPDEPDTSEDAIDQDSFRRILVGMFEDVDTAHALTRKLFAETVGKDVEKRIAELLG
eukprot:TRINITY_DN26524_c0_g1_i1.p1 TRINITY_DN26524_c0_g1~~TRINITY_DN26524_c0_g1_i1.p1  ORF type:complete len:704 (-),score=99.03 TRINITY_DN26524_c0_g1_i1:126-2144(-)